MGHLTGHHSESRTVAAVKWGFINSLMRIRVVGSSGTRPVRSFAACRDSRDQAGNPLRHPSGVCTSQTGIGDGALRRSASVVLRRIRAANHHRLERPLCLPWPSTAGALGEGALPGLPGLESMFWVVSEC